MEDQKTHRLGHRAFLLFLSKRLKWVIFFAIVSGAVWYSERWLTGDYAQYAFWIGYADYLLWVITGTILLLVVLRSYLEYRYYTYTFTNEAFLMTYGYIMRNEIAALYHQIQTVNILRSPLDRLAGVSKVVIIMTGAGGHDSGHNRITLPGVGKKKAKTVQQELLLRARKHFQAAE